MQSSLWIFGIATLALAAGAATAAPGPCENYAKYAAIRAYKAEVGTVQGSDGIQYSAKRISGEGDPAYWVTISDNNEDGETWEVRYFVSLKKIGGECRIVRVRKAPQPRPRG